MDASQIAKLPNPQLKQILLFLYGYQTVEEQAVEFTVELNDVGFNRVDAEILSSFAEQVKSGRELSEKQYNVLRLRLPKYHRQLAGGNWEALELPEVRSTNGHPKSPTTPPNGSKPPQEKIGAGRLDIDPENNGLMFTPHIFPSKQIKDIGFKNWKNGAWHQYQAKVYPYVLDDVRKMFGEIEVTPAVFEALKPKEEIKVDTDYLSQAHPSLREFQKEAIRFTANHERLLLALAPRLGKTVVSVIAARVVKAERILVVAPLSLLRDWKKKIQQWDTTTDVAIVYKKNLLVGSRWTVTNYDTLRLHPETFNRTKWDLILVDESLLIKNRKAKRTEAITELITVTKPKYAWLLSGAPTSKLYADLWAQLHALDPKQFTSYWKFADRYCIIQENQWSKYNIIGNKPEVAGMIQKDLAHIFYTRSHEDVTDLPALEPETLGVAMSPHQDKLYAQMEAEFLAELSEEDTLLAPNVLAQMLRLIQLASNPLLVGGRDDSAKWDAAVEMLQYLPGPTIIWTSFIRTVEEFRLKLGMKELRVQQLTGATPQEDRGKIQEDFQANQVDVLLAHPAVGKYGLDLFNAKSVIYLERGYNRDDYYQSLMRVRFLDQKEAPQIIHLLSERKDGGDTIDHVVDLMLQSSTDATKKLTNVGLKQLMGVLSK